MLGFEFLPTIGIDFDSPGEVSELLAAVAVLNACSPTTLRSTAHLPPGRPEADFTARVASALAFVDSIGVLGWATPNELIAIYAEARRWAVAMPTAVTHGEMYFQQVGRRRAGQLVLFDLATVGVRPRFSDLCNLVTGIAHECSWDEGDVLADYLAELERAGRKRGQRGPTFRRAQLPAAPNAMMVGSPRLGTGARHERASQWC